MHGVPYTIVGIFGDVLSVISVRFVAESLLSDTAIIILLLPYPVIMLAVICVYKIL